MSERYERAKALRADPTRHYNCFQSVLLPFCGAYGLDEETAFRLGYFLNAGMRCGNVCGALAGGLAVLGLAGAEETMGPELVKRFRERHGCVACAQLVAEATAGGGEKKPFCDSLVLDTVALVEELLQK